MIHVQGYSDDNVCWGYAYTQSRPLLLEDRDEVGCFGDPKPCLTVLAPDGAPALKIWPVYDGSWAFAVTRSQGDEYDQPDWDIRREWNGYSEVLLIDAPAGSKVVCLEEGE